MDTFYEAYYDIEHYDDQEAYDIEAEPTIHKPEVLMERFPYRYVITGVIELNGKPDCSIQEYNISTKRWKDMYLCDNEMQLMTAMEDKDYNSVAGR